MTASSSEAEEGGLSKIRRSKMRSQKVYLSLRTSFVFPGEFKSSADYQYQLLRCNVDLLKIIQLGVTFLDEKGQLPDTGITTWQFNFKFNLTEDMYAEDSVDLLQAWSLEPVFFQIFWF